MLDVYTENEFIERIHLERKQKVPIGINAECPFCGEGKSKGRKRRFYIIMNSSQHKHNFCLCHNCSVTMSIKNYLKLKEPALFSEYINKEKEQYIERLKSGNISMRPPVYEYNLPELEWLSLPDEFIPVTQNINAIQYLRNRKIPKEFINKIFWCPEHSKHVCSGMIIFPFFVGENIYGWQGRNIREKFFHTHVQEGYKIYNIYNVNVNTTVYVFESLIDSLFVSNSISMLGSDINKKHLDMLVNPIFVFDNDRTGLDKAEKYSEKGYKVFLYPEEFDVKDINEGIMKNMFTKKDIKSIIDNNTYKGFSAKSRIGIKKRSIR